jgi:TetR/AcrR family transcriptional regulator
MAMEALNRKEQIIRATLTLVAEDRLDRVTTRRIAKRVGVSQPALFRHFSSREAILVAVVDWARECLADHVGGILAKEGGGTAAVRGICLGLFSFIDRHPGLPRLLVFDVAQGEEGVLRNRLRHLMAMQHALVKANVSEGFRPGLDAHQAADIWVALVSGTVLRWQISGRKSPLSNQVDSLTAFWEAGVLDTNSEALEPVPLELAPASSIGSLDVRPILEEGRDPFEDIFSSLSAVGPAGGLLLWVPFEPKPLLAILATKGFGVDAVEVTHKGWELWITGPNAPETIDLRNLAMPEPLERILASLVGFKPGDCLLARTPQTPRFLLEKLSSMSFHVQTLVCLDSSAVLMVMKEAL